MFESLLLKIKLGRLDGSIDSESNPDVSQSKYTCREESSRISQ